MTKSDDYKLGEFHAKVRAEAFAAFDVSLERGGDVRP